MKTKLIVLFASLFIIAGGLTAQNRQRFSSEEVAKNQSEALSENLSLSDEQKQKVHDIILKFTNDRRASRPSTQGLSREQRREMFQKMQQQQTDSIKTVLTEEQKSRYDEYLKTFQNRQGRGGNRGNRQQQ